MEINTNEIMIHLDKIESVKEFVELSSKCSFHIDVQSLDRHYTINAKSILGIFSLNLNNNLYVRALTTESDANKYYETIKKFRV